MKIADNLRLCPSPATAAEVSTAFPFVIPSEAEGSAVFFPRLQPFREVFFDRAQRSGGICGFSDLFHESRPLHISPLPSVRFGRILLFRVFNLQQQLLRRAIPGRRFQRSEHAFLSLVALS
jgi:hypothetical protein